MRSHEIPVNCPECGRHYIDGCRRGCINTHPLSLICMGDVWAIERAVAGRETVIPAGRCTCRPSGCNGAWSGREMPCPFCRGSSVVRSVGRLAYANQTIAAIGICNYVRGWRQLDDVWPGLDTITGENIGSARPASEAR